MSTLGLFPISNSIVLVTKPLNMKHTSHSYRLHPLNCVDVRFKIRYSKLTLVGLKVVTLSKTVGRVCTPPLWVMWAHGFIVLFLCFLIHTPTPYPRTQLHISPQVPHQPAIHLCYNAASETQLLPLWMEQPQWSNCSQC